MKWVVIFLDVIVVPYFLLGIAVWKNAFPDYIHSEYARRFNEPLWTESPKFQNPRVQGEGMKFPHIPSIIQLS